MEIKIYWDSHKDNLSEMEIYNSIYLSFYTIVFKII